MVPEVPDLEAIRSFLVPRICGERICSAVVRIPIVARFAKEQFATELVGTSVTGIERRGKFLLFGLATGRSLVVNPMLTGRFQYVSPGERLLAKTCAVITFAGDRELRYVDANLMGKLYLVGAAEFATVPQFAEMGPDALDPALTEEVFRQRIRRHPGMVKNILTNHTFVAGIGNAYADEILFVAGVHPYRKRSQMSDAEIGRLYAAIGEVMRWAIPIVAAQMQDELAYDEWRAHLRVHRKGGQPCPVCGNPISEITAGQRITNFCRRCQP
jgi:formamidopyrimidine-DNA glycosylase